MPARRKATDSEGNALTAEEKILKDLREAYKSKLQPVMQALELKCIVPRERINVMLIGNHSAGKSSFINWYIEDTVQKAGVAIETSGFTIVHCGKKRDTFRGRATIKAFDWLEGIEKIAGKDVLENLNTEVVTGRAKQFSSVNLIDSPGLVDGNMQYPYPVDETILFFAEFCDQVMVFFDPIGQALTKVTMDVVEKLHQKYPERVTYYCSKADTVTDQNDLMKVCNQITSNCAIITSQHKFELPTIYIPEEEGSEDESSKKKEKWKPPNNIENICEMIQNTIGETVQRGLDNLKEDCERVCAESKKLADDDAEVGKRNSARFQQRVMLFIAFVVVALSIPFCMVLHKVNKWTGMVDGIGKLPSPLPAAWGSPFGDFFASIISWVPHAIGADQELTVLGTCLGLFLTYYALMKLDLFWKYEPKKSKAELKELDEYTVLAKGLLEVGDSWYDDYLALAKGE